MTTELNNYDLFKRAFEELGYKGDLTESPGQWYALARSGSGSWWGYEIKTGSTVYELQFKGDNYYGVRRENGVQVLESSFGRWAINISVLSALTQKKLPTQQIPSPVVESSVHVGVIDSVISRSLVMLSKIAHPEFVNEADGYWEELDQASTVHRIGIILRLLFSVAITWGSKLLVIVGVLEKLGSWFKSA